MLTPGKYIPTKRGNSLCTLEALWTVYSLEKVFFLFFLNRRISTTSYDEDADNEVFEDAYKSATRLSLLPETQS